MKKLLILLLIFSGLYSFELKGQGLGVDHLEQVKRMARRNSHITKTYKGSVVKMLFGKSPYGGAFNGIIFRKPDGKLLHLKLYSHYGKSIGPHIKEGQELEVTLSGDELLLDLVLHKDQYLRSLEVELKERISGLGYLEAVKTSAGYFKIEKTTRTLTFRNQPVINARVTKRIKLKNKGAILEIENGDSLYFQREGDLESIFQQDYVSYLRPIKEGSGSYFKSLNVHGMSSGKLEFPPMPVTEYDITLLLFANVFLEQKEVKVSGFSSNKAGLINALVVRNRWDKTDTFKFSTKSARALSKLLEGSADGSLKVYYQAGALGNFIRAVEFNGEVLKMEESEMAFEIGKNYVEEPIRFTGHVTNIQYQKGNRFRSLILDDSVHISINEVIELSIASLLKEGTEVTIEGWKRKNIPSEINEKGYTIILPRKVTVDGRTFTNRAALNFNR